MYGILFLMQRVASCLPTFATFADLKQDTFRNQFPTRSCM
ncbi:unnamed protein product [Amoebophrya sp. A120]|nr:unnamed protein product [Amoebophrya sp. A120]|eukprot:GSA120T00003360001.1